MKIIPGCAVGISYRLSLGDGTVIDETGPDGMFFLHGYGQIVPGLEDALLGLRAGDQTSVQVSPDEGYGEHDPRGVQDVERSLLPSDLEPEPGQQLLAQDDAGEAVPITVKAVKGDQVTIDFNHPLAGKTLHFEVTVLSVRAATAEELEHQHVHGPGGHEA